METAALYMNAAAAKTYTWDFTVSDHIYTGESLSSEEPPGWIYRHDGNSTGNSKHASVKNLIDYIQGVSV